MQLLVEMMPPTSRVKNIILLRTVGSWPITVKKRDRTSRSLVLAISISAVTIILL